MIITLSPSVKSSLITVSGRRTVSETTFSKQYGLSTCPREEEKYQWTLHSLSGLWNRLKRLDSGCLVLFWCIIRQTAESLQVIVRIKSTITVACRDYPVSPQFPTLTHTHTHVYVISTRVNWQQMVNTDQDKDQALTPTPHRYKKLLRYHGDKAKARASHCWAVSSRVSQHTQLEVRCHRGLSLRSTLSSLSPLTLNKHWNKLRDGGERKRERGWDDRICSTTVWSHDKFKMLRQTRVSAELQACTVEPCGPERAVYSMVGNHSACYSMSPSCGGGRYVEWDHILCELDFKVGDRSSEYGASQCPSAS